MCSVNNNNKKLKVVEKSSGLIIPDSIFEILFVGFQANMVRKLKKKTTRREIAPDIMLTAVRKVKKEGLSIRKALLEYQINYRTLARYCQKISEEEIDNMNIVRPFIVVGYLPHRKVFPTEEEEE